MRGITFDDIPQRFQVTGMEFIELLMAAEAIVDNCGIEDIEIDHLTPHGHKLRRLKNATKAVRDHIG